MRSETSQHERFMQLRRMLIGLRQDQLRIDSWGAPEASSHCLGGWLPYDSWFKQEGWHTRGGLVRPCWQEFAGFEALAAYFKLTVEQTSNLFAGKRTGEVGSIREIFHARLDKLEAELFTTLKKETSGMQVTIVEPEQDDGLPLDVLKPGEIAMIVKSMIADDVGRLVVRGKSKEDAVLGSATYSTGFMQDSNRAQDMRVRRLPKGTIITITL